MIKKHLSKENINFIGYLGIGLNIAITIFIFVMIGYFVDKKFNTLPQGTILGGLAGFIFGMRTLFLTVKKVSSKKEDKKN
ncbi:MAG: AtpZ/AtpI family protein [Candidatus Marinimicrobia bacterium]|nr:AtpZ/AtpI family protein [Candidatus Neomarinimicrobiota bacterium]